jgi:SET domain-containing protein
VKKIPTLRGVGVFATKYFRKNQWIARYVGESISLRDARVRQEVCFCVDVIS